MQTTSFCAYILQGGQKQFLFKSTDEAFTVELIELVFDHLAFPAQSGKLLVFMITSFLNFNVDKLV